MKSQFQEFLEENFEVRSYSGRGMYGRECIAINVDDPVQAMQDLAWYAGEQDIQMPSQVSWDSMGRGYVVYWPWETFVDDGEDDEEEEE